MARHILVKPIISEKAEGLSEKLNQYSFVVDKTANKIEIKKAVAEMYNVSVKAVNTLTMPGKYKSRSTKSGIQKGRQSSYKKAIITLAEGDEIDFFSEI
jgi:large subunit ribosomal protein L23